MKETKNKHSNIKNVNGNGSMAPADDVDISSVNDTGISSADDAGMASADELRAMQKRWRDKRYRRSEAAIFRAFFEGGEEVVTISGLARQAGIGRTTFYRHHGTMAMVVGDYEERLLQEYGVVMEELVGKASPLRARQLFWQMVLFISQHQKVYAKLMQDYNVGVIYRMLEVIRPWLAKCNRGMRFDEKAWAVYSGELVGLVMDWQRRGFDVGRMRPLVEEMVRVGER